MKWVSSRWNSRVRSQWKSTEQTKGRHGRVVLLASRLRRELEAYVRCMGLDAVRDRERPLFATQKRSQFTANKIGRAHV